MPYPYGDNFRPMTKNAFRQRIARWSKNVEALRYAIRCKETDAERQPVNASGYLAERDQLRRQLSDALAALAYWKRHAEMAGALSSVA